MSPAIALRRMLPVALLLVLLPTLVFAQGPGRSWGGLLTVRHVCSFPDWDESAQMNIEILPGGGVIIGDAAMSYGGTEDLGGGCIYERTGDWEIYPFGWYREGPPVHIEINENVLFSEHLYQECPPPVGVVVDEYPEGTYDGHLAFMWEDAILEGAVVSGTGDPANDVIWTLTLIPGLPVESRSWSAVKALY